MNKIVILCIVLIVACRSIRVFDKDDLINFAKERGSPPEAKLRWNGYYNNIYWSSKYQKKAETYGLAFLNLDSNRAKMVKIQFPVFFFLNGVFIAEDVIADSDSLIKRYLSKKVYNIKSDFGLYTIRGDTITVLKYHYMQNYFRLPRWEDKLIMYRGLY